MDDRVVIDTRSSLPAAELPDADLTIGIDSLGTGKYNITYMRQKEEGLEYEPLCVLDVSREEMVGHHVRAIQAARPKTVEVRAGAQRTRLHPGVVKSIIEGKLEMAKLVLR